MKITRFALFFGLLLFLFPSFDQLSISAISQESVVWHDVSAQQGQLTRSADRLMPTSYRLVQTNFDVLSGQLTSLTRAPKQHLTLELPLPNGKMAEFTLQSAPIMEPRLAAKYFELQTFTAKGITDPTATGRIDITPYGFHAYVQSAEGEIYIDPFHQADLSLYISYFKNHAQRLPKQYVESAPVGRLADIARQNSGRVGNATNIDLGNVKRTYQMAVTASGEFIDVQCSQIGAVCTNDEDSVQAALASIVTGMNRVNQIYERELSISFVLVDGTDNLLFPNAAVDPFTNVSDVFALLDEGAGAIEGELSIGSYDIGHVFGAGEDAGGGIGFPFSCETSFHSNKVTGATAIDEPVGDPFWVDYVAHEVGHQFFAGHSYNASNAGACTTRDSSEAYEPGSGTTIMSYAGICDDQNLQNNVDAMFNAGSYNQIANFVTNGQASTCADETSTGNTPPTVSAGPNYTIPRDTPFTLTASVTDEEQVADDLTISWEQFSLGRSWTLDSILPNTDELDNESRPIMRVYLPANEPNRTFPRLENILDGTYKNSGEDLPSVSQTLTFRATARDNAAGAGGISSDDMQLIVDDNSGPFRVLSQPVSESFAAGDPIIFQWDVARPDQAPVFCRNVDIMLSIDGGQTFTYILEGGTSNDGFHVDTIPISIQPTAEGRVQIRCNNNIFFDMSKADLTFTNSNPNPFSDFVYIPLVVR
ncbi:MAG: reprolysin-like metallopeptidase [Chloroflexota bacterium]